MMTKFGQFIEKSYFEQLVRWIVYDYTIMKFMHIYFENIS